MSDDALKKALNHIPVPAPSSEARDRALHRSLVALKNQESAEKHAPRHAVFLRWFLAGAIACLTLAFWMGLSTPPHSLGETGLNTTILNQVTQLFPDRLEAVVEQDGQMDVRLSSQSLKPSEQPLMLVLRRGAEVVRVLSYSGRQVCLNLDGHEACLELFTTDNDKVIVTGNKFLWSQQTPSSLHGYRIEARTLPMS